MFSLYNTEIVYQQFSNATLLQEFQMQHISKCKITNAFTCSVYIHNFVTLIPNTDFTTAFGMDFITSCYGISYEIYYKFPTDNMFCLRDLRDYILKG